MGLFKTGGVVKNKGHTFYEFECSDCLAKKWIRKDHVKENMKQILCIETDIIYKSLNDAAIDNNISPTSLSNCITGRSNSCINKLTNKKMHFKLMED